MDNFRFRFSQTALNQLEPTFQYWITLNPTISLEVFIEQIQQAFQRTCLHPKMKQVVELNTTTGFAYRRVNVWRFAFLYRIDEDNRELVIDRIYHELSDS